VVAVVVGVEHQADRFVRRLLDQRHDDLRAAGEIRVDHERVLIEHDPTVVAVAELRVAQVEKHAGRDLARFVDLGRQAGTTKNRGAHRAEGGSGEDHHGGRETGRPHITPELEAGPGRL
jgi:hypothetical protein